MLCRVRWCVAFGLAAGCGPGPSVSDAGNDGGGEPTYDAFRPPVAVLYRNEVPPSCQDRSQPPRWRVTSEPTLEGTVLWTRSLSEPMFAEWRLRVGVEGLLDEFWYDTGPSLTGDGVATWFFARSEETWAVGFGIDGVWSNSGSFDHSGLPRVWLPRLGVLHAVSAAGGWPTYVPTAPTYAPESPVETWQPAVGLRFWPDGARVGGVGDTPAWSPVTGDFITFGGVADGISRYRGAGAGCADGVRWFTQLPIYEGLSRAYVRPDGDAIIAISGEMWVLDGDTGELVRTAVFVDESEIPGRPSAYQPGCGILIEFVPTRTWRWLNDETMELGPLLSFPDDRLATANWSGTSDCGLIAQGGTRFITRLNSDGSVRFSVRYGEDTEFITTAGAPIPLADGGALVVLDPPGWLRLDVDGALASRRTLDRATVGQRMANEPTLAPDGTLYFMTQSEGRELRFSAASTRAVPGRFLWRNSGGNWARTNSVLPE